MRKDNYDENECNKPIILYFLILLLMCGVAFLIISNFHLSQQVNDLQQQILMLSSGNATTVSINTASDNYTAKEDVADEVLIEKEPPSHGSFLEGGEDISHNDLYNINADGFLGHRKYAPLEIKIPEQKGNMYYLKFHCPSTDQTYIIFAHSGEANINVNLLCGDYNLTYAVGSKWYGKDHLFGSETRYFKGNSIFSFYHDGDVAHGESLILYQDTNDHVGIEEIDANDF